MRIKGIIHRLIAGVRHSTSRFAVATLLCAIYASLLIIQILSTSDDGNDWRFVNVFMPIAAIIATATRLWREDRCTGMKEWMGILIIFALWGCISLSLALTEWRTGSIAAYLSSLAVVVVMTVCAPFLREDNDLKLWNFTLLTAGGAGLAVAVTAVVAIALPLLLLSVETLFALDLSIRPYECVQAVCWAFIFPLIFLQTLPEGEAKHNHSDAGLSDIANRVTHYFLVPLLALYFILLYIYAIKILIERQLPDGMICTTVTIMLLGLLTLLALFYPSEYHADRTFDHRLRRLLPLLALPLLFLMTIAIARRISDYGLTVARLYMATLNLWGYGSCLYLLLRPRGRFSWIVVALAGVMFIMSVGPWSYSNIVLRTFKNDIRSLVSHTHGPSLPMASDSVEQWVATLDSAEQAMFLSRGSYLRTHYEAKEVEDIITADALASLRMTAMRPTTNATGSMKGGGDEATPQHQAMSTEAEADKRLTEGDLADNQSIMTYESVTHDTIMLADYRSMTMYDHQNFTAMPRSGKMLAVQLPRGIEAVVSVDTLRQMSLASSSTPLYLRTKDATFVVSAFRYDARENVIQLTGAMLFR